MGGGGSRIDPKDLKDLKANTRFSESEIKKWYRKFSEGCPDGVIHREDMTKMFLDIFPKGDPELFVDNVFRTYDTNNDGHIDFREFMIGISTTSKGTFDQKIQWAFEIYDQDGNGFISKTEAASILTGVQKMHGIGDTTPYDLVEKMFKAFDKNMDGKLSKEEFIEGSKEDPSFGKLLEW